jgi:hypothetical protein
MCFSMPEFFKWAAKTKGRAGVYAWDWPLRLPISFSRNRLIPKESLSHKIAGYPSLFGWFSKKETCIQTALGKLWFLLSPSLHHLLNDKATYYSAILRISKVSASTPWGGRGWWEWSIQMMWVSWGKLFFSLIGHSYTLQDFHGMTSEGPPIFVLGLIFKHILVDLINLYD